MVSAFSSATNNRENPWYNGHFLWESMEKVRLPLLGQYAVGLNCMILFNTFYVLYVHRRVH